MKKPTENVWLAVGGIHELGPHRCKLLMVQPPNALEDLKWEGNKLVMRADAEGTAELECDGEKFLLHMATAASLEVILVGEPVKSGTHFDVRAVPRDAGGRELQIGRWTEVAWSSEGDVAGDNDPSAGEFGLCDTCFGQQGFKAGAAGTVTVKATFGPAAGEATIPVI